MTKRLTAHTGRARFPCIRLKETVPGLAAVRAFLFLIDDTGDLVAHWGRDAAGHDVPELTGYSASLVQRVRQSREPLVVTGTDEGAALGAQSVVLHGLRSILVALLQLEGRLLGVVYLDSRSRPATGSRISGTPHATSPSSSTADPDGSAGNTSPSAFRASAAGRGQVPGTAISCTSQVLRSPSQTRRS
jgi:hypothetical protein